MVAKVRSTPIKSFLKHEDQDVLEFDDKNIKADVSLSFNTAIVVPSATILNLSQIKSNLIIVSGNTPITTINMPADTIIFAKFQQVCQLANNANIALPGDSAGVTKANDILMFLNIDGKVEVSVVKSTLSVNNNSTGLVRSAGVNYTNDSLINRKINVITLSAGSPVTIYARKTGTTTWINMGSGSVPDFNWLNSASAIIPPGYQYYYTGTGGGVVTISESEFI